MISSIALVPIYGFALIFFKYFTKKISSSIFFAISFIVVFIYLSGLLNVLLIGVYVAFYGGILAVIYFLLSDRQRLWHFIGSVPIVVFTLSSLIYLLLMKDSQLFFWDEYSHWGPFIKEIFYYDHFYDASSNAVHLRYPPGMAIWGYFILKPFGFYSEGSLYFAYFLVLFSATLMLYENLTFKRVGWILIIFVMQMAIFSGFGHWFSSIYVDHVIAALFVGLVLSYLLEQRRTVAIYWYLLPCIVIVLVKEIGLFFCLGFLGLVCLLRVYEGLHDGVIKALQQAKGTILGCMVVFVCAYASLQVWNIRQDTLGVEKESQTISGILSMLADGGAVLDTPNKQETAKRFWHVVFEQQLNKTPVSLGYNEFSYDLMGLYHRQVKISTAGALFFFLLFVLGLSYMQKDRRDKVRVLLIGGYLLLVTSVYMVILYFSYLVGFGEAGRNLPSFVRYMNMGVMPLFMVLLFLFLPAFSTARQHVLVTTEKAFAARPTYTHNSKIFKTLGYNSLLILPFTIVFLWITAPYFKALYTQKKTTFREQLDPITAQLLAHIPSKARVFVVFPTQRRGDLDYMMKYMLLPTKATISDYDFLTNNSQEAIFTAYKNYDYLWFPVLNQEVIDKNKVILRKKEQDNTIYQLYRINSNDNTLTVESVF